MAISTFKVFLMKGTTKLLDIKDYPDLGGEPEMLETTTLSDRAKTYIPGLQDQGALQFTSNYDLATYNTLKSYEGTTYSYAVWFGGTVGNDGTVTPTGADGKFEFDGQLSVWVTGKGVNEVAEMVVSIAPSTVITQTATVSSNSPT